MKKLLALAFTGLLATAYSQGLVNGVNASSTDIYTFSIGGVATAIAGSATASYEFELLTAPSTVATGPLTGYPSASSLQALLTSPWSDTGLTFQNAAIAGRVNFPNGSTVNNWPGAEAQSYVVVGWSGNLGNWANVQADIASIGGFIPTDGGIWIGAGGAYGGYLGVTVVGNVVSGATGSGAGPNIWGPVMTGSSGINTTTALYPIVPEPPAFGLATLGAATLLLFRRRR